VTLDTKPDVLTKVVDEYACKYKKLIEVLDEVDISGDQVQQNNFKIYSVFYGEPDFRLQCKHAGNSQDDP
jgi:hypothetical protein